MGDRHHYLLHFTTAIISFLVFGLVPPLVYGFSFRDTDDGDLKLAVVAGASLLCITLLAIGKAYIQKPHKWEEFVKTVVYYIALGYGAAGLSYLAGKEFDKLLDQLGWFKRAPTPPTLLLPNMDFSKPSWGSLWTCFIIFLCFCRSFWAIFFVFYWSVVQEIKGYVLFRSKSFEAFLSLRKLLASRILFTFGYCLILLNEKVLLGFIYFLNMNKKINKKKHVNCWMRNFG